MIELSRAERTARKDAWDAHLRTVNCENGRDFAAGWVAGRDYERERKEERDDAPRSETKPEESGEPWRECPECGGKLLWKGDRWVCETERIHANESN